MEEVKHQLQTVYIILSVVAAFLQLAGWKDPFIRKIYFQIQYTAD